MNNIIHLSKKIPIKIKNYSLKNEINVSLKYIVFYIINQFCNHFNYLEINKKRYQRFLLKLLGINTYKITKNNFRRNSLYKN
jgi:hypothetical protein